MVNAAAAMKAMAVIVDRLMLLEEWYALTSHVGRATHYADNGETALHFDQSTTNELQRIDYALTPVVEKVPV